MIARRIAFLAFVIVGQAYGVHIAQAQDFLQELFGPDAQTDSHRSYGRKNPETGYRSGEGRFRDRGHAYRGGRGQSERPDDGARPTRAPVGSGSRRDDDGDAALSNGTEFCVRTCDGYFFPLIKSAQQTKQASCEYACPSAPVAYYHGASIESARNLNGEKYTSLPTAFKFREKVSPGCACHPPEDSQQHSLKIVKNDPTAHSGDIVVEQKGAFVYHGRQAVPIDRSRQVSASVRQNIQKMTAGPTPADAVGASTQRSSDGSSSANPDSGGRLSGAARPMGELDATGSKYGEGGRAGSWVFPAAALMLALSGAAVALRLLPSLKRRLSGSSLSGKAATTLIDLIDTTELTDAAQAPLAWVWSEYRGVLPPLNEDGTEEPSRSAAAPPTGKEHVETDSGAIDGYPPTSIAWVWGEYRGAL